MHVRLEAGLEPLFGRIGRLVGRLVIDNPAYDLVAVNDLCSCDASAHLFNYDSVHGIFKGEVESTGGNLKINGKTIQYVRLHSRETKTAQQSY